MDFRVILAATLASRTRARSDILPSVSGPREGVGRTQSARAGRMDSRNGLPVRLGLGLQLHKFIREPATHEA
jgi:hypothetical protein